MAKRQPQTDQITENDAFEMIELASNDLDLLSRAFDVINEVCKERFEECEVKPKPQPAENLFLH